MTTIWQEIVTAIGQDISTLGDAGRISQSAFRLIVAALSGAVLGVQRARSHQAAGLRTHMLVTIGAALFVLVGVETGGDSQAVSRIIQGVVTGIGFIGAGAIIKFEKEVEVRGLTTAAGIWMATAIGMAAGLGRLELALTGTILAFVVLSVLRKLEKADGVADRLVSDGR
jgi:putative Mg2+ transporter-C (MgtC) family protein